MVGTQAKAEKEIEKNRKAFKYPKDENFITPIEYSLIYSMILEGPKVYPENIVLNELIKNNPDLSERELYEYRVDLLRNYFNKYIYFLKV